MNFECFSFFSGKFPRRWGSKSRRRHRFHSIFVGVKVKEETTAAKENSTIISSKWRPHLYWKGKRRKRTSFRRNSYISKLRSLEL